MEQVLPDAAAVGIGIDFQAIVRRSLSVTWRYIFCTIKCFVRIHRDVFQSQHLGHQDLVRWAIGADHLVVRSLRQGDCCQLGVRIIVFYNLNVKYKIETSWNRASPISEINFGTKKLLDIIVISEILSVIFI